MSGPWMKFYPSDWRADPALRMCSIGARGLWMEMLCIMHEADGFLVVNRKPLLPRQLAALAGIGTDEVTAFMVELSDAGVFSRDENGTVYSRRMRKDIARAEQDKANGRKGGNPSLNGGVNPPDNPPLGRGDKAQKPEARDQIPEAEKNSDTGVSETRDTGANAVVVELRPRARPPDKRARQLPADFALTPERLAFALREGLSDETARREFSKFTASAEAHGRKYVSWDRAWENWVRTAIDGFGGSRRPSPGGYGQTSGSRLGAMQRAVARFANQDVLPE